MNTKRIERIFESGCRAAFVLTGGGSSALNALLTTPGASRFVCDAHIPYSPESLERLLGEKPEQSVSPQTARAMAKAGQASSQAAVAVSCTAALATDRERRGDDRAFICIRTGESERLYALHFSPGTRAEQEAVLSGWLLVLIAQALGAERTLMLPGSFNPVHQGHFGMLKAAEEMTGLRGVFELSTANVDKSEFSDEETLFRASAIRDIPVALTCAPRFVQKAELFPSTTFALGFDTAERLIDYAQDGEWDIFQTLDVSFLVAGRRLDCGTDAFQCLEQLDLPMRFEALFDGIPEEKFREDISSTDLRESL